jgi:16S rRNA (cytosine967-C5)-methyltransferase
MQLATYALIAEQILATYTFPEPLSLFVKKHFSAHKKYGSRDRKVIAQIIYNHLRLGKNYPLGFLERYELLEKVESPYILNQSGILFDKKLFSDRKNLFNGANLPVNYPALSSNLETTDWLAKMTISPYTFIRSIRDLKRFEQTLTTHNIPYTILNENTIALPQKVNLDVLQLPDSIYAIQDASSQKIANRIDIDAGDKVWDVCAASGGKSLAILAKLIPIELTVSDIRSSILKNLEHRFKLYNYQFKTLLQHDATLPLPSKTIFDKIICDVPCSGSGTWARTPEQLYYFDPLSYKKLLETQTNILKQVWSNLKVGGVLYYITCSVFQDENETQVNQFLDSNNNATLLQSELINGIENNADFLYLATIQKTK